MNFISEHVPAWNGWLALLLYWLPMTLCVFGYTTRSVQKIRKDRANRAAAKFYVPSITVGTLVGYALLMVCPIANLFAAVFDVAPKIFGDFLEWCGRVLDIPLVPRRENEIAREVEKA
jgi:hypothetical protein